MSISVALYHRTTYRYDRPVSLGPQVIRLRPAPHCRTRVLSYSLKVLPEPHFLNWQQDPQSNHLARLVFPKKTTSFEIEVDLLVAMEAQNPFDFFLEPYAEKWPFAYDPSLEEDLAPYRRTLPGTALFEAFLASVRPKEDLPTSPLLVELNRRVSEHIHYNVRLEPGLQTPEETLQKRSGSCRDSAWLLVQILRRLGFAARFSSGYLIQLTADTKPLEGPLGPKEDFVDLHAWCEVYLPGAGWIGLDPTSGLWAGEGHLPLACTAEPQLAAPVTGLVDACETTFEHEMRVMRVLETPRVTKPYTEEAWSEIVALGQKVDLSLQKNDVRLTMGSEPTFVSIDDLDADEWNTAALGPNKRKLSRDLFFRLRDRYAKHGLVHFGQGKWYPGEPLPRWALSLFWRKDGEPLWSDPSLVADEASPSGADESTANALLCAVAEHLGLPASHVFPAYEDVAYALMRERKLPVNVDPKDSKLDDPLERERFRKQFTEGLGKTVGHVFPVAKVPLSKDRAAFRSGPWHFRGGHCFLVPGDSPIGLRLPLDSLPWLAPADRDPVGADPSRDVPPLSKAEELLAAHEPSTEKVETRLPKVGESATWNVRSAMCAEARGGVLYVFMPPLEEADDYVELVAAVFAAASKLRVPVLFEGYTPPRDPRIASLSVTPDPGVVEVNVHPTASWDELVDQTTHLYEAARLSRLSAEKFMIDGRHVGTGGGHHLVLGARTTKDSPFLRRPDLLRSLIAYFQKHPSLSYLFSGMFIGPTSQAPRIDEARTDSLYEIEIAFAEVSRSLAEGKEPIDPWLTDRLFRDLLVDVTGNTHRSELCIDKLYSPDSASGRLGLVEMRGFEMPPHARMCLAQQLLMRSLVAWLWEKPFTPARLTRWGTELHDRFMLPAFVWDDFAEVLTDLGSGGFTFSRDWFLPHYEFRFPKIGDFSANGVDVSIRAALEPWHVMGEDATSGGTARYVDSSVERVEVRVFGLSPERYAVTCNGRALPLRTIGRSGTFGEVVAGVRFRAWQPPRCLHPHIKVHSPLTFDLVDSWSRRSLGGCEVHVVHPGGRTYDTRPVNALEAEGRRRTRFSRTAHTPGTLDVPSVTPNEDFPFTLDLRRG
jgi:uncharacterized protein (DUF2126 family)/transglutaminase-like putative cysteine protease